VRVAVPRGIPLQTAYTFFDEHLGWVQKSQRRIEEAQQPQFDSNFKTRRHILVVNPTERDFFLYQITAREIRVFLPAGLNADADSARRFILQAIIEAYRLEARQFLPARLAELAKRYQFHYNRVFIKNLKSRWGSCSIQNNINLNAQLMRFEDRVIDYILLHELLHTRIKNHSPVFWKALSAIYPDVPAARKILKRVKPYVF